MSSGESEAAALRDELTAREAQTLLQVAALEVRAQIDAESRDVGGCRLPGLSLLVHGKLGLHLHASWRLCYVTHIFNRVASQASEFMSVCFCVQAAVESEKDHSDECQTSAEARLAAATADASTLSETVVQLRERLSAAETSHNVGTKEAEEAQATLHDASARLRAHEAAAERSAAALSELRSELEEARGAADRAKAQAKASVAREETALAREGQVADALADTQSRFSAANSASEQLAEELRVAGARVDSLESEVSDSHARADAAERSLAAAQAAVRQADARAADAAASREDYGLRKRCAEQVHPSLPCCVSYCVHVHMMRVPDRGLAQMPVVPKVATVQNGELAELRAKNVLLEEQLAELRGCVDALRGQLAEKGAAVVSQIQEAKVRDMAEAPAAATRTGDIRHGCRCPSITHINFRSMLTGADTCWNEQVSACAGRNHARPGQPAAAQRPRAAAQPQ